MKSRERKMRMQHRHRRTNGPAISTFDSVHRTVRYRGHALSALAAERTYEEVAYLLLHGSLPDGKTLKTFSTVLVRARKLPGLVIDILARLPAGAHPMDVLHAAMATLGIADPEAADTGEDAALRKAVRTIAALPTAVAASHRISRRQAPIDPAPRLGHAENFLYMLSGYGPDKDAVHALEAMLLVFAEHRSDASTLAARAVASSLADYHSAATAAVGCLRGRPSRSGEQTMRLIEASEQAGCAKAPPDRLAQIANAGAPEFHNGDPRTALLKRLSRTLAEKIGEMNRHRLHEKIGQALFRELGRCVPAEFYAGSLLRMIGVPPDLFTPVCAAGRIAGWSAHIIEQLRDSARAGTMSRPRPTAGRVNFRSPRTTGKEEEQDCTML